MRAALTCIGALLLASPAMGQIVSPLVLPSAINTSDFATKTELAAKADASAMPQPDCAVPTETVGGAAGSSGTYTCGQAKPNRITRAASCTTSAAGTCTVTYTAMPAADPNVITTPINTGSMPVTCNLTAVATATSASIKCWTAQTVTVSLLGASVAPFTTSAAGVTIQITTVPKTQ